jgi:hypothetical protein
VGIDAEIKTEYPYLIIQNENDFINITSDGMYPMNKVVLGSFYDVLVNDTESNVDGGFLCNPIEATGTAALPFVNILFVCDYTCKEI